MTTPLTNGVARRKRDAQKPGEDEPHPAHRLDSDGKRERWRSDTARP